MKPPSSRRPFFRIATAASLLLALAAAGLHAETRTLTDRQGRSLKAEILSVNGDQVSIKRDDGQTFTLSLATLSDDDQKALKAWAAKQAAMVPPGGVTLAISRGKFDTKKKDDGGMTLSEEQWGYDVTFVNHTSKTLADVRVDYILFVKPDTEPGKDTVAAPLKQRAGSHKIDVVGIRDRVSFRTDSITLYKQQLKPGWIWAKTGSNSAIRDTLYGVWLRAYVGDQLVDEQCSPESLSKTERWTTK